MGHTITAIVCVGLYLISCHFAPAGTTSSGLVGFIGIGYDILKGNPEGDFKIGGTDPGYKLAHNILKRTYVKGKTATFNRKTIRVPDQIAYQALSSCSSIESVSVYDGTKSYQKKLDINAEASASGSYGLFKFRFSLSTGYSQVREAVQARKKVMMDKTVICSKGKVRYLTSTALNTDFSISDDFYYTVKRLPLTYDQSKYIQFIKDWGTHYIESATVGGRLTTRYQSSYVDTYKFASENIQSSISAGGSYLGYSGSFKLDINTFSKRVSHTSKFGSRLATTHSGSNIVKTKYSWQVPVDDSKIPIPIKIKLIIITDAFQKGLWTTTPDKDTYDSLQINNKLQHLKKALARYPSVANAPQSSDPNLVFPNAWPDGTYTLPKAIRGCPSGGNAFTWREGWIHQDNEDKRNSNKCPSPRYLAGYCNRNLRLYYCSKTVTSSDFGIKWPKGSYCILMKGSCPSGFSPGYVHWDDEDSRNANKRSGVLPKGDFNRNTRIYYCCRRDRHPHNKITLPTDRNFFLILNHADGCQEVKGMRNTRQSLKTDDEDRRNSNSVSGYYPYGAGGRNHRIGYCYYYK